jgi:preprotein translocase subunit SecA
MSFLDKIFDSNQKQLRKLEPFVKEISAKEAEISSLKDSQIKDRISKLKDDGRKISDDKISDFIDDNLVEVFALVREATKRVANMRHFDVQIMAGVALAQGKLTEVATGEGKTLIATLPLTLYSLLDRGAHIVTVNDYLARRDGEWCGHIYNFLGLSVGIITPSQAYRYASLETIEKEGKSKELLKSSLPNVAKLNNMNGVFLVECSKKEAYACDITYGTNNDLGFDYLRDNLVYSKSDMVMRDLFFCIVDEADSVLIDEARTPLIISDPVVGETQKYILFARLASTLSEKDDYELDEKNQAVTLTESGIDKVERFLKLDDIWSDYSITYHLENALKARAFFKKDDEYIVKDGKVVIVDEFTGRLMPDRRFSEGLHQAIEAKEGVEVLQESKTLATITFQNFFRLYKYLSGMTGTALTEAEEFFKIYKLDVIVIPTNKPNIRIDSPDRVYRNKKAKFNAVIEEIETLHSKEVPILVGTTSVEASEELSLMLKAKGISHNVLNAKYYDKEAQIVSHAGEKSQVTIATNMAGRGTDIVLGEGIKELGGLHVIGTQRHESRRIDNQLRGRSGRQGDPGYTRFYVSLDDDLMRIFGGESVARILGGIGISEDIPIESRLITKQIESAQKKVEGHNFDIRKTLVDYDDIMNKHREVIYARRRKFLNMMSEVNSDYKSFVMDRIENQIQGMMSPHADVSFDESILNIIITEFFSIVPKNLVEALLESSSSNLDEWKLLILKSGKSYEKIHENLILLAREAFEYQNEVFGDEVYRKIVNDVYLQVMSFLWTDHIDAMNYLQQSIRLQGYAQVDPLTAYKSEAFNMFDRLIASIDFDFARRVFYVQKIDIPNTQVLEGPLPSQDINTPPRKVGRNDPCFCGSGKKYKNCHGKK